MNDEIDEIVETGERLPAEMWESGLPETIMATPIFDGVLIIDQKKE